MQRFPGGILAVDYFGDVDLLALRTRLPVTVVATHRDRGLGRSSAALGHAALDLTWDAVVYGGGLENRPGLLRLFGHRGTILGNDPVAVRQVRNPAILFRFLDASGLPHARTDADARHAPSCDADRKDEPTAPASAFLWKRTRGGGGGGVLVARPGEPRPRGHHLQRLLHGVNGSAAFLSDGRRALLLGASRQISGWRALGGDRFRYGGSIAGALESWLPAEALRFLHRTAGALTRRFGLRGLNGFDFILHEGRPCLVEVNPRYTASMELFEEMTGGSLMDLHLSVLGGEPLPRRAPTPRPGSPAVLGKGILYADASCVAPPPDRLAALGGRDLPAEGEVLEAGQPVCTIVAPAASPGDCVRELELRANRARRMLAGRPEPPRPRLPALLQTW